MSRDAVKIRECCSCGAVFRYEGDWSPSATIAAQQWRDGHIHSARPVEPLESREAGR